MKLGIPLLVIGVALLILAIPYSTLGIISGVTRLEEGNVATGVSAYYGIIDVVIGFVMTTIGAIRVFKQ